jgi:hypothetical protein
LGTNTELALALIDAFVMARGAVHKQMNRHPERGLLGSTVINNMRQVRESAKTPDEIDVAITAFKAVEQEWSRGTDVEN